MLLLKASAPCLLLALLGQLVSLSCDARKSDQTVSPTGGRAQRSGNKGAARGRGKFATEEKMQCAWVAKDVRDAVQLRVKCENPEARIKGGITDLRCEYNAKPRECPAYLSDPQNFWKQVGRALKRLQGKVCKDERALVRAGMCKLAPRSAHFKLDTSSSVVAAQAGDSETLGAPPSSPSARPAATATTACTRRRADHRKTAEELCSSSWASVCAFFLSMVQSEEDC